MLLPGPQQKQAQGDWLRKSQKFCVYVAQHKSRFALFYRGVESRHSQFSIDEWKMGKFYVKGADCDCVQVNTLHTYAAERIIH